MIASNESFAVWGKIRMKGVLALLSTLVVLCTSAWAEPRVSLLVRKATWVSLWATHQYINRIKTETAILPVFKIRSRIK